VKRYLVIMEPTPTGYSAYLPDIPGCVTTGRTTVEVETNMREALALHFESVQGGETVPPPTSIATYVDVSG
jgi:predicted RNase H-like HicB family nuclease